MRVILIALLALLVTQAHAAEPATIMDVGMVSINSDANPDNDSVRVIVMFGDERAEPTRSFGGSKIGYNVIVRERLKGGKPGEILGMATGVDVVSKWGEVRLFVKLKPMKDRTMILAEVDVALPSMKKLSGRGESIFLLSR